MSRPVICPHTPPFHFHRTMAEVIHQEELDAFLRRPRTQRHMTLDEHRRRA